MPSNEKQVLINRTKLHHYPQRKKKRKKLKTIYLTNKTLLLDY